MNVHKTTHGTEWMAVKQMRYETNFATQALIPLPIASTENAPISFRNGAYAAATQRQRHTTVA